MIHNPYCGDGYSGQEMVLLCQSTSSTVILDDRFVDCVIDLLLTTQVSPIGLSDHGGPEANNRWKPKIDKQQRAKENENKNTGNKNAQNVTGTGVMPLERGRQTAAQFVSNTIIQAYKNLTGDLVGSTMFRREVKGISTPPA